MTERLLNNSSAMAIRPLVYAMMLALGLLAGMSFQTNQKDKFTQILDIIQNDYVDSTQRAALETSTIEFMLSQLDPHSAYIPPDLSEVNERQIRGNYFGLGVSYIAYNDSFVVYSVFPNGPADKAGIQPGDRLIKAGAIRLTDSLSSTEIQEAIQSGKEAAIDMIVYRRSINQVKTIKVIRGDVIMNSSEVYYMVNKTVGYIRIERFSSQTHDEFLIALKTLKTQGMKDLILDLRNNGGGLLQEATQIANEFLQADELISYTQGLHRQKHDYKADGKGTFTNGKLIVLINHNTASASEILSGALQDNDRAVVIGNRSYGKGLVQEPFKLADGSTIRLTIARYYTPSGRSIQKHYTKDVDAYHKEIYKRDIMKDTLSPILDPSIKKVFFSKNGRLLTAGGGIRPDIFLRDTIADSTEIERLMPGLFYSRLFDIYYLDHIRPRLLQSNRVYDNVSDFMKYYSIEDRDANALIQLAQKITYLKGIKASAKTKDIVKKHLKAAVAYSLFGEKGKSLIINQEEGVFSTSIEAFKQYNRILHIQTNSSNRLDY